MNSINSTPGLNVSELFNSSMDSISRKGTALSDKMNAIMGGESLGTEDMLVLQFEIGQYNAMMESLSTVTKSLTDMMKSLAQRSS